MNSTKTHRLAHLFAPDGKCLIVALDHAGFMDKPLKGLERPEETIRAVGRAGADAFLIPLGSAQHSLGALGRAGLWLSVDAQPPLLERVVETALRLGADGVKCMFYPWDAQAPDGLPQLAALAADCAAWGMPLMAEVIPGGFGGGAEMRTPDKLAAAARMAMEAGADVIKTFYTGDAATFQQVVSYCPIPLVVLGGERAGDDAALLNGVRDALAAGAAGVAIGRNVWGHPQTESITARLRQVVHSG